MLAPSKAAKPKERRGGRFLQTLAFTNLAPKLSYLPPSSSFAMVANCMLDVPS
jgi:hypothetical protein